MEKLETEGLTDEVIDNLFNKYLSMFLTFYEFRAQSQPQIPTYMNDIAIKPSVAGCTVVSWPKQGGRQ